MQKHTINEKDWKIIRSMKDEVLDLACDRIFAKVSKVIENDAERSHARYLELWEILKSEDDDIATMFDDLRRSNAISKLANWNFHKLIADDDMKSFSPETQERVKGLNESWR